MSVILLRKLTKLSLIDQGKYKGFTVGEIMKLSKLYIIKSYFKYANITFTDDILDELRIRPEDRLVKPGKDEGKINFYTNRNLFLAASITSEKYGTTDKGSVLSIKTSLRKQNAKASCNSMLQRDRRAFSRRNMQARNHGKSF